MFCINEFACPLSLVLAQNLSLWNFLECRSVFVTGGGGHTLVYSVESVILGCKLKNEPICSQPCEWRTGIKVRPYQPDPQEVEVIPFIRVTSESVVPRQWKPTITWCLDLNERPWLVKYTLSEGDVSRESLNPPHLPLFFLYLSDSDMWPLL